MNQDFTVQKKQYLSEKKKFVQRGSLEKKFLHKQWAKKKNSCKLKIPHPPPHHFSNGPSLSVKSSPARIYSRWWAPAAGCWIRRSCVCCSVTFAWAIAWDSPIVNPLFSVEFCLERKNAPWRQTTIWRHGGHQGVETSGVERSTWDARVWVLPCLVPRPHYHARPMRFGSRGPRKLLRPI